MERSSRTAAGIFFGAALAIVALDIFTKLLAHWGLPPRVPQLVLGQDWFRLTLVYNKGAAFGLHLGDDRITRVAFTVLTIVALVILWRLYKQSHSGDRLRVLAVALVCGGALGNLIDRVRWSQGVVDFIDVGVGAARWPTFNIADAAVSTGALALAIVLWREERSARHAKLAAAAPATSLTEGGGESSV